MDGRKTVTEAMWVVKNERISVRRKIIQIDFSNELNIGKQVSQLTVSLQEWKGYCNNKFKKNLTLKNDIRL